MDSHRAEALVSDGLAFEEQGQLAESIRCYLEATQVYPTPQAHLHLIGAQMRAEQFEQAHQYCKIALAAHPQEATFHLLFARLKEKLVNLDLAQEVLRLAVEKFPDNLDVLVEYAAAQFRTKQFAESIPTLERVIALQPSAAIYRALSKMMRNTGDKAGARRVILEGLDQFPLDVSLARACADQTAAARAQATMRAAAPTLDENTGERSEVLRYLTEMQAAKNRGAARLGPMATSWSDLLRWPDADGMAALASSLESELRGAAPRAEAVSERAMAAVAQGDWAGAEHWFAQARRLPTHTVADVASFDPEFFGRLERMTDEEIWSPFPPTYEIVARTTWPAAMIYVSCDPKYFELFMGKFLDSLVDAGSTAGVHFHLLDGTEADWIRLAKSVQRHEQISVSMTAEGGMRQNFGLAARNYYHAARYVRFYHYLRRNLRPLWMMDVDLVAETDPTPMFEVLESHDFAVTTRPVSLEPWAKFQAGLVGIAPTVAGLRYSRLVAAYISHWFRSGNLHWGIDQMALFAAYFYLEQRGHAPETRFLGEEFMNDYDGLPCIIRPVTDADSRWEKNR